MSLTPPVATSSALARTIASRLIVPCAILLALALPVLSAEGRASPDGSASAGGRASVEGSASASANGMKIEKGDTTIAIAAKSGPILEYPFAEVPFKPYVKTLHTPAGIDVLRDAPHDHLHHHALMYAIKVEDVTFWSESADAGRQVHRAFAPLAARKKDDIATAAFTETLDWVAPGEKGHVLTEERTVRAYAPAPFGATLVTWSSALRAPEGKASVKLGGDHYYGLGARFLVSMDAEGRFLAPEKVEGEVVRGDERLTPGRWYAYTAKADGKPVTFAMFDSPSNPRKALWFTMKTPFAYLSATVNLWRDPMTLDAGKTLRFTYGVAVWDGEVEAATIEALYEKWVALRDAEEKEERAEKAEKASAPSGEKP